MSTYPLQPYKNFAKKKRPKRSPQKLNKTATSILQFLVKHSKEIRGEYNTFSSDPLLLRAVKKSQSQLSKALRDLHSWGLLCCGTTKSCPVLYYLHPKKLPAIKRLLANNGVISASLIMMWARNQMGWFTTRDVAKFLNISKRHAQKLVKILVDKKMVRRIRLTGKAFRGRVVYVEASGGVPLDHFLRRDEILGNLKLRIYGTKNPFF